MWVESLCNEDTRAHRHTAVTPVGTMGVYLAAFTDRFERGLCAAYQFADRDREEGTVYRAEPEGGNGGVMRIRLRSTREAHVDDESHAEFAEAVVISKGWHIADKEVIRNCREVHTENRITIKTSFTLCKSILMLL